MSTDSVGKTKSSGLLRLVRWLALAAVVMVTLVALLYAVENFRGRRAWADYRQSAAARGLVLDFKAHVPAPVPEEQNGASIPLIESWFDPRFRPNGDPALWPGLHDEAENLVGRERDQTKRRLVDLVAWQQALAAAAAGEKVEPKIRSQSRMPEERAAAATNVLAALKPYEPALEQLRESIKRPHFRYPVEYNVEQPFTILLPHLQNVRRVSRLLALRSSAHVAAGRPEAAAEDVLLSLALVDSFKEEHFLISYLVRAAMVQLASHAVWEGLVQQQWTDAQLKAIQERAGRNDFLLGLQRALETERAAGIAAIDWIKSGQSGQRLHSLGEPDGQADDGAPSLVSLMPRGWWDMEKVSFVRLFESQAGPMSAALKSGSFAGVTDASAGDPKLAPGLGRFWKHEMMAAMLLPALDKVQRRAAVAQATVDQMVTACALERARLATGQYPETLAALTPAFLPAPPRDVMTGQPLLYRPRDNGYLLYSVGWDRDDDGGAPGKTLFDLGQGDWTWHLQPASAAPPE